MRHVNSKPVAHGPGDQQRLPPHLFDHSDVRYHHSFKMEHTFTCPSCGEGISMVLDLSVSRHTYIEDCEVCCNPIEISYTVQDDTLTRFEAKTLS